MCFFGISNNGILTKRGDIPLFADKNQAFLYWKRDLEVIECEIIEYPNDFTIYEHLVLNKIVATCGAQAALRVFYRMVELCEQNKTQFREKVLSFKDKYCFKETAPELNDELLAFWGI